MPSFVKTIHPRSPVSLFLGNSKAGVFHSKRIEYPPFEDIAQWGIFDARQEQAEKVGRVAILKTDAWLVNQG